jgi:hypothetical protein
MHQYSAPGCKGNSAMQLSQAHVLCQNLVQDPDQLIVDQRGTPQGRVLQALDLLLDNDFKASRPNKESRG